MALFLSPTQGSRLWEDEVILDFISSLGHRIWWVSSPRSGDRVHRSNPCLFVHQNDWYFISMFMKCLLRWGSWQREIPLTLCPFYRGTVDANRCGKIPVMPSGFIYLVIKTGLGYKWNMISLNIQIWITSHEITLVEPLCLVDLINTGLGHVS